jgi:Asp-tRNA(Asn)/Glu-tRNA(Gln) amidotransferase A subunit family amidase
VKWHANGSLASSGPWTRRGQLAAWIVRYQIGTGWAKFSQDHPTVLAPVCCERPRLVGDDTSRIDEVLSSVLPVNLLGLPLCAVPVGCDEGLPQGVQRIAVGV